MKAEKYIKQKSITIYSGGMNSAKVITEEDALSALDLAKKETIEKACKWWEEELSYPTMTEVEISWIKNKINDFRKAMEE